MCRFIVCEAAVSKCKRYCHGRLKNDESISVLSAKFDQIYFF